MLRMLKNLSATLTVTLLGVAGTAHAQGYAAPFGSKGQVTFAAERLFGFHWVSNSWEENGLNRPGSGSGSGTSVGFGWIFAQHLQFNQPRLGVDFFVVDNISIGGALGFFSMHGNGGGTGSQDGFIISPRVGFNIPLSPIVAFWPKVGLTYISVDRDHALALSGEGNFVFFPRPSAPSWGFMATPTLDLAPFGGSDRDPGPNADFHSYSFGISAGILGVI